MSVDWDEGYKKGKKDERERIIELIKEVYREDLADEIINIIKHGGEEKCQTK